MTFLELLQKKFTPKRYQEKQQKKNKVDLLRIIKLFKIEVILQKLVVKMLRNKRLHALKEVTILKSNTKTNQHG
ncbi:hypothetical protein P1T45_10650 [Streptococcus parauberis]|nr:hypothetical protein [Streptococcus parauberis]WEM65018.1 hypothetical protein P1T45_10650 [Streptococcus parauberis]